MADAFTWAVAAAPAASIDPEALATAWRRTADEANTTMLESSAIAWPLCQLVEDSGGQCSATATRLLDLLNGTVPDSVTHRKDWPKDAKALAAAVRRIAPALRAAGIDHWEKRESDRRLHHFTRVQVEQATLTASPSSPASPAPSLVGIFGDDEGAGVTQSPPTDRATVTAEASGNAAGDHGDGGDDDFHPLLEEDSVV